MKKLVLVGQIREIEQQGDDLFEKDTLENSISALNMYALAQMKLYEAANDMNIVNAKPYPHFNSDIVAYKAWYMKLNDKMMNANSSLSNPRLVRT